MNTLTKEMFFKPKYTETVRPQVGLIGPLISQVKHKQKFERTGEAAISKNVSQRRVFPWLQVLSTFHEINNSS